jgi:uncharacterized SAM-binding protein YcdF (DUF218 family)
MRRLLGFLLLLAFLWFAGLVVFVSGLPARVERPERHTDAIVVVTGGSERLAEGIRLLNHGLADKLLISGVNGGTHIADIIATLPPQAEKPSARLTACCILAGYAADSTLGNAAETAGWMRSQGLHSLRLVTADYHMPRSLLEFRSAMPEMEILAHPVFPDRFRRQSWWRSPGTANLLISEYDKYLVALLRIAIHGRATQTGGDKS